ncbi:hypothetical protein D9M71_663090 [compost metagenome]
MLTQPQALLQLHSHAWHEVIRCLRHDHDGIDISCSLAAARQQVPCCRLAKRAGSQAACNPDCFDTRAMDDAFDFLGAELTRQLRQRQSLLR